MEDILTGKGPSATHGQQGVQLDEDDSNNEAEIRAKNLSNNSSLCSVLNLACVFFFFFWVIYCIEYRQLWLIDTVVHKACIRRC